jgi:FtsH-binding integral membrane protein
MELAMRQLDQTGGYSAARAYASRADTGSVFGQTMALVAVTAGLFTLGAYLGRHLSSTAGLLLFVASFVCLIGLNVAVRQSEQLALGLLFGFGLLLGLAMAPTVAYYAQTSADTVWQAGGATALFIAGSACAGYATKRDLSRLARASSWALIGLIAFGIVMIFASIPHGSVIYAVMGLAIFAGLTMYDFQRIRTARGTESPVVLAASIFLDILNVLQLFLMLFGRSRR